MERPTRGSPPAPAKSVKGAARGPQRKAALMRWLRRVHLYSGLLLLPWVLVYGVSGFLFNHGGSSSPTREVPIPPEHRPGLLASAPELGGRLLEALDQEAPDGLTAELSGAWTFDFHAAEGDRSYRLTVPLDGTSGRLVERATRASTSSSIPRDTFGPERAGAERTATAALAAIGVAPERLRVVGGPSLRLSDGERRWSASLTRDRVSESGGAGGSFDLGQLMRRLHVTHGYRRSDWPRLIWAAIVDVMAFAMVMWAFSGIAMWWQKKSLRTSGTVTLAIAFVGAVALIASLQALFAS